MFSHGGRLRALATGAGLLAVAVAGLSCGSSSSGPSGHTIADYVSSITAANGTITAVRQTGSAPAAGSGPSVTATGGGTVINGGSAQVSLTANANFNTIIVAIQGVSGYYEITLPASVSAVDLLLTLAQRIPNASFNINYGVDAGSGVGAYQTMPVSVIAVGSGEVQVSVSWNAPSDVDLHVVDPSGDEVYYGSPSVASGGMLDLDSNADCVLDNKDNENITWATAPSGTYTVRVDYYKNCGVAQTNYVVTVQRKGHAAETFSGTFTGPGDLGTAGSGTDITTFTVP